MVIAIKSNLTKAEVEAQINKFRPKKRFDAKKYAGKVLWGQDGLEYQKELRSE